MNQTGKQVGFDASRTGECVAFGMLIRIIGGRRIDWHVGIDLFSRFSLV